MFGQSWLLEHTVRVLASNTATYSLDSSKARKSHQISEEYVNNKKLVSMQKVNQFPKIYVKLKACIAIVLTLL